MTKEKKRNSGWDAVNTNNRKNFYDYYDAVILKSEYEQYRIITEPYIVKIGWIPALSKKGKGNKKGTTAYPVLSLLNDGKKCPLAECGINIQQIALFNVIDRSIQEQEPSKKIKAPSDQKFRQAGDKFWSPVRVLRLPIGAASTIKNLGALNKVKTKKGIKTYPLDHPQYGRDILISYDPNQSGNAMYSIQKDDERSPLTEEEQSYLIYDLEAIFESMPTAEEIKECILKAYSQELLDDSNCNIKKVRSLASEVGDYEEQSASDEEEDYDMDDEEFETKKSRKKSSKKSSKKKPKYEEDEYEDEDEEDPEADFEEVDEDGFDDIDEEDQEEDEEEEKPRKNRVKPKQRKHREEDDDDEEDEPHKRNRVKPKQRNYDEEERPRRTVKRRPRRDEDDE